MREIKIASKSGILGTFVLELDDDEIITEESIEKDIHKSIGELLSVAECSMLSADQDLANQELKDRIDNLIANILIYGTICKGRLS